MKLAVTTLVFCVAALLALGMVMLYSASMAQYGAKFLVGQLLWCGLGLGLCATLTSLDYRLLKKFVWPLFIVTVVLLALVFVKPVGVRVNGASRWLGYHKTSFFQPSEAAKLVLLIMLAFYGERFQRQMPGLKRGVIFPALISAPIIGLIFFEMDVGNALLLSAASSALLIVAGIRLRYFLPPVLAAGLAVGAFIYHNPMRSERIYSWLHVEETKQEKGLQAYQSMVAFGSGGLTGKGLGDSRQKLGFLPFQQTDFIFPIIGEELGLIATLLIVVAFVAILICGIYIAWNASDMFGLLLGTGIVFLVVLQAFINIGVVTGVLPNKGLPLPFISRGGSNLVAMLSSIGILLSIARNAKPREALASEDVDAGPNPFARKKQRGEHQIETRNPRTEVRTCQ
jgi:cell division protein FtsW